MKEQCIFYVYHIVCTLPYIISLLQFYAHLSARVRLASNSGPLDAWEKETTFRKSSDGIRKDTVNFDRGSIEPTLKEY